MIRTQQRHFLSGTETVEAKSVEYENAEVYSPLDVSSCTSSARDAISIQYQKVTVSTPASRKREERKQRNQKLAQLSTL